MHPRLHLFAASLLIVLSITGCQSTDRDGSSAGPAYYDTGFNDPWYYGDYHDDIDIIVTPPDERPPDPAKPAHPIVLPPTPRPTPTPMPMPSIPRMPTPRAR